MPCLTKLIGEAYRESSGFVFRQHSASVTRHASSYSLKSARSATWQIHARSVQVTPLSTDLITITLSISSRPESLYWFLMAKRIWVPQKLQVTMSGYGATENFLHWPTLAKFYPVDVHPRPRQASTQARAIHGSLRRRCGQTGALSVLRASFTSPFDGMWFEGTLMIGQNVIYALLLVL